jgi:hypothetical protein
VLCKEGDVAVGLMLGSKELLLCHLSVIDKGDELPFAKIYDFLRYILGKINNTYLMIIRRKMLIGEKRVVDDPLLSEWGLRVLKLLLVFLCQRLLATLRREEF